MTRMTNRMWRERRRCTRQRNVRAAAHTTPQVLPSVKKSDLVPERKPDLEALLLMRLMERRRGM